MQAKFWQYCFQFHGRSRSFSVQYHQYIGEQNIVPKFDRGINVDLILIKYLLYYIGINYLVLVRNQLLAQATNNNIPVDMHATPRGM